MKIKRNLIHTLPLAAILGLSGLAFVGASIPANEKSASANDDIISMTVNGDLSFEITPEVGGTYAEKSVDVKVKTSNATGYTLYMESKNAIADASTKDGEDAIKTIDSQYSKDDMPINSWGYYVGNTVLNPIPVKGSPNIIAKSDTAVSDGETTAVTVGVKVAPTVKSGDYENSLIFTAFANEADCGDGFFCIETMQEMTPQVCSATTTPLESAREVTYEYTSDNTKIPRTILKDARDGKKYLVSKYADGNCWMSQNLALDLSPSRTLTSKDTNLANGQSWTPTSETLTDLSGFYTDDKEDRSYKGNVKYLKNGFTPSDTPSTDDGKSEWESVGNYYNWISATAGTGKPLIEDEQNYVNTGYSICPSGWRLPDYDDSYDSSYYRGEYGRLLNLYYDINPFTDIWGNVSSGYLYPWPSGGTIRRFAE